LLEICCHSEVCWKEFVAIWRCMIWRRHRVDCQAHGPFFWWLFVCEACRQEIEKNAKQGANYVCMSSSYVFSLCVHS
jgi:hypothetical protein